MCLLFRPEIGIDFNQHNRCQPSLFTVVDNETIGQEKGGFWKTYRISRNVANGRLEVAHRFVSEKADCS